MNYLIAAVLTILLAHQGVCSHSGWMAGYSGPTAVPELLGDGTVADTPAVAAARAAHLAALHTALASNPDDDDGQYDPYKYGDHKYGVAGHHQDTNTYKNLVAGDAEAQAKKEADQALWRAKIEEELAAWQAKQIASAAEEQVKTEGHADKSLEKAELYSLKSQNAAFAESFGGVNKPYDGPLAMLQVLPSGYIADTAEVAAARRTHLSNLAAAERQAAADLERERAAIAAWRAKQEAEEARVEAEAKEEAWRAQYEAKKKTQAHQQGWN